MAVYKLQLKNKQFSILSTAWDKGKSIYKRLKGWLSKKPALIPKGPASDVVYNSTASAAKNGAKKAGGYADLAGQGGQAAAKKSGGYLQGTQEEAVEAIRNRKQAAKNAANGGNGANNANNTKNGGANNGNVKNNQNQSKQNNNSKKPAVYKVGNGKGITFNKVRSNTPNMNGFTTTLSRNPYDLGGYSGFKYSYK